MAAAEGIFVEKWVRTKLALDPMHLGDVAGGVREHLNRCLMRYSEPLQGVPTHVVTARLEDGAGTIVGDAPGVQCSARAKYMVFAPEADQLLLGEVNAVSGDHIGMLIFNNWNASIPRTDIPEQYEYDHELGRWCDRDFDSPLIEAGTTVTFAFRAFEMGGDGAFSVIGSLTTANTGPVKKDGARKRKGVDDAGAAASPSAAPKPAKRVKVKAEVEREATAAANGGTAAAAVTTVTPKKKSKKKKAAAAAAVAAAAAA
eukprot:CAMPEP_0206313880 /NCGR_PEP_ID=MMETSP0106_2-20121207/14727_1 /ASSEMBLY_ACC=CAM_ASM_000206 /TAXON_ID=81532 /ORGANISM="Acanthoeca-like sp., Strain 10tr" /LENGTH=257 /DNA_ID=CAMNT_0053745213 /DNA_START=9 /DNA_END=778 /DNA_ORIENTATION=-